MRVLFVHQNFPAQFRHTAAALAARPGHQVVALAINERTPALPGVTVLRYRPQRSSTANILPLAADIETKLIRGEAAGLAAMELRRRGFRPDLMVVHPGWGEHLFLKDVFPDTPMLAFLEFFYRPEGLDTGFDPEFEREDATAPFRTRARNLNHLAAFDAMDHGLSPTHWQRASLPKREQARTTVIFDGCDTGFMAPDAAASFPLPDGRVVRAGDEVLTFVNRNLEPYRGFHVFMRALPAIQRARPEAITLIVGGDEVSYGRRPAGGGGWRDVMLKEVGDRLDLARIHFLGRIPYDRFRTLLQVSRVHAYLTYPFVLSWSMIEAMACGALVVGSATGPVTEVIREGENGLLVPFFDREAWESRLIDALARPEAYRPLRARARADALARYDLATVCLPAQLALYASVAAGRAPRPG